MPISLLSLVEIILTAVGFTSFLFVMLCQFTAGMSRRFPISVFSTAMCLQVLTFLIAFGTIGFATTYPWSTIEAINLIITTLYLPTILLSPGLVRWFTCR